MNSSLAQEINDTTQISNNITNPVAPSTPLSSMMPIVSPAVADQHNLSDKTKELIAAKDDRRSVGVLKLAMLTYFLTGGGPFGMEEAVGAAGPMYSLIACFVLPFAWALPEALVTAELSSLMPENGGSVVWIQHALGDFWGFIGAWNSQIAATIDLAIYPVLVVDYIPVSAGLSEGNEAMVRLAIILIALTLNLFGLDPLAYVSYALVVVIVAPFVLLIFASDGIWDYSTLLEKPDEINLSVFLGAILWAYTGWDRCGAVAGEVRSPSYTYPRGVALALTFNVLNFTVPIFFGYLIAPNIKEWGSGYFTEIALSQSQFLGDWVLVATVLSSVGQLNAQLATASRTLWAMADGEGMALKVPRFLHQEWRAYETPVTAIIFNSILAFYMTSLPFDILVTVEMVFACIAIALVFISFLRLKIHDKSARAYEVPGGVTGAWLVVSASLVLLALSIALSTWTTIMIACLCNVGLVLMYSARAFFVL